MTLYWLAQLLGCHFVCGPNVTNLLSHVLVFSLSVAVKYVVYDVTVLHRGKCWVLRCLDRDFV